jgi:hypothetical protein
MLKTMPSLLLVAFSLSAAASFMASSGCAAESCEGFENQPSDDEAITIYIENHRDVPVYIPTLGDCTANIDVRIEGPDGDVNWRSGGYTCTDLMTGGCGGYADAGACFASQAIRLDPGGRYPMTWDRSARTSVDMPDDCFARPLQCGPTCLQVAPAADGTYAVSVEGGTTIPACDEPETAYACDCEPNTDGWCELWEAWESPTDLSAVSAAIVLPDGGEIILPFE